ncbi:hypothetical protein BSUW23_16585 [Bacillus spizizenii str. W23]|uniref:Uncharacterized protein n=1 Tax=Bacillus spizizenii (strain ATCC 23059 / NRRL B-14472 / W23) TaxID=655816 RepID=E0U290_BACSH|nr:hypothetical protein BSUW23_16585 [Bacillus spizizenii str. W23]EFG93315.1 hypothetical protein BSU6633_05044 [Bacillus spizizenii ATCC 6633 = JCM 2499]KFK78262.1 hypothetical protein DJ97_1391 [Bacillus spizizenii]
MRVNQRLHILYKQYEQIVNFLFYKLYSIMGSIQLSEKLNTN